MFLKSLILIILFFPFSNSIDTINPDQVLKDGQFLFSKGNKFQLGFFTPGNSSSRYLGIWYVKVPEITVVWVANRNNPINGDSGILSINQYGNLVLHDSYNQDHPLWSTNISEQGTTTSLAQLQDSGNLVLVLQEDNKTVLWESFDYPTDTMLPGMKLGLNLTTGLDRYLISWKSQDDPGTGDWTFKLNPAGSPQFFLFRGSTRYWRSGPWPWINSSPATASSFYKYDFVNNQDGIYYTILRDDPSVITRSVVHHSGQLRQLTWSDGDHQWKELWSAPSKYRCDQYGDCGAYSRCSPDNINRFECDCLPGYEPKSPRNWNILRDGKDGCVRMRANLSICQNGEGFEKLERVKVPDTSNANWMGTSMSFTECQEACLRNCSCSAFLILDIADKGSSCLVWYGELLDILEYTDDGLDLYLRVDAIEFAENARKSKGFFDKKGMLAIPILSVAVLLVAILTCLWLMNKRKTNVRRKWLNQLFNLNGTKDSFGPNGLEDSRRHPDLVIFDLTSIAAATDNFSLTNKLGQGGFGSVYKGLLSNGQQIAVKRLSDNSGQGIEEFKNEVVLIAKLQHRNLVKLLGCCIQGEEKMLIYEYMPNKSLDYFIFDHTRSLSLNWRKRFEVIIGIARGILYLHQDSRLRIIHRDLKTSNILLDAEMNPKISDFGMARIIGEEIQYKTTRVVGTYGYMSPEYVVFGHFSIKSDVFSFGVILLEILSGKRNNVSYLEHHCLTLIGHVWDLWRENRTMEIADPSINDSYHSHEVLRCIQTGLLCVQEDVMDRPTMSAVVLMLSGETTLPSPKQPAFIFRRPDNEPKLVDGGGGSCSVNEVTITKFEAR